MGTNLADAFDRYVTWIALFLLLTAVNLAMEAGAYLVNESLSESLRAWAMWPSRAGSIVLAIGMIGWARLLRGRWHRRHRRAFLHEFTTEAVRRSASIAFFVTLCLVAFLDVAANDTQLPADFFIKLPGLSLTAGFSLSFLLFNRADQTTEDPAIA